MRHATRVPRAGLCGFKRIRLEPGESQIVLFRLTPSMMELVTDDGKHRIEAGKFRLTVGGSSPGVRSAELGAPEPVTAEFTVH